MASIGLLDNEERTVFIQTCHFAHLNNTATITTEELTFEIIKWAERHNNPTLRIAQATKKIITQLLEDLLKHKFCHVKTENDEIIGVTLLEPEIEQINSKYKKIMERDITLAYPQIKDLVLAPKAERLLEIPVEDISNETLEKMTAEDRIGKIIFDDAETNVLVTPHTFYQVPGICLQKMLKYFRTPGNMKIIDHIIKNLEIIITDKAYTTDKVLRIIGSEDKENPEFFVHFCENLATRLHEDRNIMDVHPIYQSALMLKQFKMQELNQQKDDEKLEDQVHDMVRLLDIMKSHHRVYSLQELYLLREDNAVLRKLSGSYQKTDFMDMINSFIGKYTKPGDGAELSGQIPYIIRIYDNQREVYIHRGFLITLVERDRVQASNQLKKYFFERWKKALVHFIEQPEMNRDKAFETEVAAIVKRKYTTLESTLRNAEMFYNLFLLHKDDADLYSRMKNYFAKPNKSSLKKYYEILELDRSAIYRDAYSAVPFVYRFFFTRLIMYIANMFAKKKKEKQETEEKTDHNGNGSEGHEEGEEEGRIDPSEIRKNIRGKMRNFLGEIEKNYRQGGNAQDVLDALHEKWNNKLGDVRKVIKEKVDRDVMEKSVAIYRIMLKSPNFNVEWLHKELRNLANRLSVQKYTDIGNKKALAQYIIILSIATLRSKTR